VEWPAWGFLAWGFLAAGLLLLGFACRDIAAEPHGDMGSQMYFSGRWLLGSVAIGASSAFLVAWWAGLLTGIAVFALRWPFYRLFEGRWAEPRSPPKDGFKEFIRKAEKTD